MQLTGTTCCGLEEIEGLSDEKTPRAAMLNFCNDFFDGETPSKIAFVLFTGVTRERYGQRFCEYIRRNRVGTVIQTRSRINPNSCHKIKAWIWSINLPALERWNKRH